MTAREDLVAALEEEHNPTYWGGDPRDAEALINAYVRELAGKLRRFGHYMAADRLKDIAKQETRT